MSELGQLATVGEKKVTLLQNDQSEYVKLNVGGFLFQTTIATLSKFDTMFKAMFSGFKNGSDMSDSTSNRGSVVYLQNEYVKLNVGGFLFQTTVLTLTKFDTMFKAMFSGRMEVTKDSEGWIYIDRNGEHFRTILKYLRDGSVSLPKKIKDLKDLLAEARYYLIEGLIAPCESRLERSKGSPLLRVRMFSSEEKEAEFIAHSKRPLVKLSTNRTISEYPYESSSDTNFLKNRELFGKLCLKCSSRIIFIQNEKTTHLVCCWSFYNNGQKVSDIHCASTGHFIDPTSLATKVDFPEAKIYEEVVNLMMQEFNLLDDDLSEDEE